MIIKLRNYLGPKWTTNVPKAEPVPRLSCRHVPSSLSKLRGLPGQLTDLAGRRRVVAGLVRHGRLFGGQLEAVLRGAELIPAVLAEMCAGLREELLLPAGGLDPQRDPVRLLTVSDLPELDSLGAADLFFPYHLAQEVLEELRVLRDEVRPRVQVPPPPFARLLVRVAEQLLQQKPDLGQLRSQVPHLSPQLFSRVADIGTMDAVVHDRRNERIVLRLLARLGFLDRILSSIDALHFLN